MDHGTASPTGPHIAAPAAPAAPTGPVALRHLGPVRPLAFGCEPLGGYAWGAVDPDAIGAAVTAALGAASPGASGEVHGGGHGDGHGDGHGHGARMLFDTADTYGPHVSETRLGGLLAGWGATRGAWRDRALLASKFGVRLEDGRAFYDTSPGHMDRALDGSLTRLGVDRIDLYQLHWPDGTTPLETTFAALEAARAEGRIGAYGVSNVAPGALLPLLPDFPGLATFSLEYSLIARQGRAAIRAAQAAGPTFVAYGALGQGLLSGKYDADTRFAAGDRRAGAKYAKFHGAALAGNLRAVAALRAEAQALGLSVPALALRFVLADLPGALVLAGIKSPAQLAQNLTALGPLAPDIRDRLIAAAPTDAGGTP
ncbi:MAG: aldo/keto reductase [Shimia sp.]